MLRVMLFLSQSLCPKGAQYLVLWGTTYGTWGPETPISLGVNSPHLRETTTLFS